MFPQSSPVIGLRDRAHRANLAVMGSMQEFDLVVIGSGPGGQKAAIAAAKLGKSVAVIERGRMLGGVCVNTGTIPSKTLREAVVYLTGMSQRELYGSSYRVKERITPADLLRRTTHVIGREQDVVRNQLLRNGVELFEGHGRFLDAHTLVIEDPSRDENVTIQARYVVIATGTKPVRPSGVKFDEERVLDSDGILDLKSLPQSMVVVGAGVIGIEYASMFAALGTKVTVIEKRPTMLDFCDSEIIESLKFHLRDLAVTFRFGEEVTAVDVGPAGTLTTLASGKQILTDVAEIIGAIAIARARDFMGAAAPRPRSVLTERQRECVLWSARGKTAGEIADILGISVIHVNRTFRRLSEEKTAEYRKGAIDLLDKERLAEISSFDSAYLHFD